MEAIDRFKREHELEEIEFEIEWMHRRDVMAMNDADREAYSYRMYELYSRKDQLKKELER